mmetsp:Transcript_40053/g.76587  ORF Transcript_40053/g.76587 Transcript_40053/m.76587 type:complete len:169 (-) Transcript_40053:223-729(-)
MKPVTYSDVENFTRNAVNMLLDSTSISTTYASCPSTQLKMACDVSVLLVDDNFTNLMVLHELLKSLGITKVSEAPDGDSAMEMMRTRMFDLVLMDLQMPGRDGYEVTAMLQKEFGVGSFMALAITASTVTKELLDHCLSKGFFGAVGKPVSKAKLTLTLSILGIVTQS